MSYDFTAIDFETANGFRGSPCSVGVIKVRAGEIVDERLWMMRPPEGFDHFDPRNVQIHGVTPEMVAAAPRFGEVFAEMDAMIGGDLVVAHNAAFDLGVIRSALEVSELPGPAYQHACTVILSRRSYNLASYSLPFVAEAAGVPLRNHHDALEDARACAGIMIDIGRIHGAGRPQDLEEALGAGFSAVAPYRIGDEVSRATQDARNWRASGSSIPKQPDWAVWPQEGSNPDPNPDADPAHPLFGQNVVFTGNLGISRQDAKNRAAGAGASTASRVTRKTTVLVVGDGFVAGDLTSGRLTSKAREVLKKRDNGQRIEVVSEGEFLQMVGGAWPATV
ncbi:exonuclease domain-containing protein [Zhihengliuella salsuginis]|uniref:DNA polymerase III subunit epsilon n=1 Tax=Zhihengliuella salsuginis TaxID=578222 RepID=A0ABQ3GI79_9MICC|nr:exonuclease domain-containing protein [Zhihengliuella salsuginis]GHD08441.1 DNA polymerase III subunit epsilon [Zhihengliuella salsuginis]